MDYEKKYKEALEKLQEALAPKDGRKISGLTRACIEEIFPELKESGDEKMRKSVIYALRNGGFYDNDKTDEAIAWLEKQETSYTKKDIDDAYLKGITDTKNEIKKQHEANYQIRKDIATFIFNYKGEIKDRAKWMNYLGVKISFVEKQDNQKPQGKLALEAVNEEKVDNQNCATDKVEPKFKVGDWVVISTTKGDRVVQIASVEYFTKDGHSSYITTEGRWFGNGTEARLLTDKDVEIATIPESKAIVNKIESWSEEDEKNLKRAIWYVEHSAINVVKDTMLSEWLKSIKGRVQPQPKQEWSEEDEKIALSIEQIMNCASLLNLVPEKIEKVRSWLKSLKERIGE